jgi:hypothetical protein
MNKSNTIKELATALVKVQAKLQPAAKDAKNPFFKSNCSTLNSVWDACRQLLTENGLAISQVNQATESGVIIETILMHESGEWISGEIFLPLTQADAQGVGSATSYGRRYGLAAIVGIVADEDDDGNAASHQKQTKQQPNSAGAIIDRIQKNELPMNDRIINAQQAIRKLGGKVSNRDEGETDEAYLESLTEQYRAIKKARV